LGADSSGNGNNWTPNNLAATDQVLDSPSNNFTTLNPLMTTGTNYTYSEGNLKYSTVSFRNGCTTNSIAMTSGKWYWEIVMTTNGSTAATHLGVVGMGAGIDHKDSYNPRFTYQPGTGNWYQTGSNSSIASSAVGDIIGFALDVDLNQLSIYKNNSSILSGHSLPTNTDGGWLMQLLGEGLGNIMAGVVNFGQDSSFAGNKTAQNNTDDNGIGDFYYAPPSGGYLALCTSNLPDISIALPEEHFNTVLWSGDNSSSRAITTGIAPDFVWYKDRTGTEQQSLYDSIRGAQTRLTSNSTATETNRINGLQSFDSTGFTVGSDQECNLSGRNYVGWNWKAGGTASSNTDGTITSTVSANTTAGFSIVSYTGTGANATVGHGLSQRPDMFIVKNRSASARSWVIWAESFSGSQAIEFDTSGVVTSTTSWNSSLPTSTVINLGTRVGTNESGQTFIAYCFHSVEGYSKIGSYTGNGSSDGAFVYTGFRPAFVMFKQTNYAYDWSIIDNKINPYNVADTKLSPHNTNAELTNVANEIDFVSNGFKCRNGHVMLNGSYNYLYLAFAESPFKYSNAR
jgi:hypothetical protein